ncbi:hypothetical protein [Haloplanus rubicundus]|uniref:Uncharacterized protein n=1 Tax=Haloplanus rubicundus TaxID=1547898 RepID=A0A345E8X4_9EURY|nr:hypothetical protein [Haloplanus rubicundus]AXG08646.1 hypothetical protein DU484_01570 [Haloplanus rubicundus]
MESSSTTTPVTDSEVIEQAFETPIPVARSNDEQVATLETAIIGGCFSIRFVQSCAGFYAR